MQENKQETIMNSQVRDSGGKIIFGDNTLCSQFLRDYIPLPYLKDVQPEDIEDVSDRFVPLFAEERNADRVKKVNIRGEKPFFLVSLIEHKTHVDYNVCMQIFRYMVYIWDAYEKEEEQKQAGISKLAGFKVDELLASAKDLGSVKLITSEFSAVGSDTLRSMADKIRDKMPEAVAVFADRNKESVTFAVTAGKAAIEVGVMSGKVVSAVAAVAGGKGGGRPDFAMAGAKDTAKIADALASAEDTVKSMLK